MKKFLPILVLSSLFIAFFSKPVHAQCVTNTFNFRVTDQNGNPLQGAFVPVYWKGNLFTYCSTDSTGQCYVCLSCAQPCELSGDVEYQGHTGSYSGAYNDEALIKVAINIPVPSPTPSPPPYPTPSPYPYPSPTPTPPPPPGYSCDDPSEERLSRPNECKLCNETDLFCASCATSFTVSGEVSWEWRDKDNECEGNVWVIRDRSGEITINPSDTTIPFVGYKGGEDEIKYLADYFEGTHDYYKTREYPLRWGPIVYGHGVMPIFTTNYQGVLRKLTPYEYQNQLKREMVQRAKTSQPGQEGSIHDYQLNYLGRLCWDVPLALDILADIAGKISDRVFSELGIKVDIDPNRVTHYCLFEAVPALDRILIYPVKALIDEWNESALGHLFPVDYMYEVGVRDNLSNLVGPPEPNEEDYAKKWDEWKFSSPGDFSSQGKLWEVAPMVSREDTKGHITPYLGSKPEDTFIIKNPEALVEKVPHVARLYEATQIVNNILTPYVGEEEKMGQKKASPIIASAKESTEEKVLGEKTLLAQGPGCVPCGYNYYYGDSYNDCSCMGDIKPNGEPNCRAEPGGAGGCPIKNHWRIYGTICGWSDPKPIERGCNPPDKLCCGGSVNPNPPPDIPTCGLPGPLPVYHCEQPAITDPNDNDDLCCEPINIDLTAKDMFINENYTECTDYTCGPTGTQLCPDDPCLNKETRTISRDMGINLLHPYLTEIWDQTGNVDTSGLFNSFRPAIVPEFEEIDASSEIHYSQTGFDSIGPTVGKFYFNYLGGVQLAKDWLIRALTPWVE